MPIWNLESILETIEKLSSDTPAVWGSMSPQRMVEHLTDTLRIATGKNPQTLLIPEDKVERMQAFLESDKPMAKGIEVPFAPKTWTLRNEELDLAIDEFTDEWLAFEEYFSENPDATSTHSFYGDLNFDQWLKLNDKHVQHHFEQFNLVEAKTVNS
ncbi:MAG: DUF1569 domain-containing protein [Bacteroidetes bacterium]|nr:DUF1569 domain-containing protein [Bacteroidota bacterium]